MKKYSILALALSIFLTPFAALAVTQTVDPSNIAITGGTVLNLTTLSATTGTITNLTTTTATSTGTQTIPAGTSQTAPVSGNISIDTTDGQFHFNGGTDRVLGDGFFYPSFSFPSGPQTATTTTASTTIALGPAFVAETWSSVQCWSGAGTVGFQYNDGTNNMDFLQATSTVGQQALTTNNTFVAQEKRFVTIGPMTASYLTCTVRKALTAT